MIVARFRAMRALLWSGSTRKTPHCGVLLAQNDTLDLACSRGARRYKGRTSPQDEQAKKHPVGCFFAAVKETKSRHRRVWNPPVAVWNQSEAMNGIKPTNIQPREGLMPYHSRCEWIPFRRAATDAIPSLLRRLGYKKRVALFIGGR